MLSHPPTRVLSHEPHASTSHLGARPDLLKLLSHPLELRLRGPRLAPVLFVLLQLRLRRSQPILQGLDLLLQRLSGGLSCSDRSCRGACGVCVRHMRFMRTVRACAEQENVTSFRRAHGGSCMRSKL